MIDILKSPAEGSGGFVVLLDVADQLSGQVSCRSEDPASDDIALDFGKPDLDLIKPAGIGRGVMDSNRWIGLEGLENILGFMWAQVVSHDVNLAALRMTGDDVAQKVASQPEGREIHIVADNLSAHKTKNVFEFLQTNPTVRIHYTPTYSSWLNQVEIWFSKIQRDVIARGIFTSTNDLSRKLIRYIKQYNKTATQIGRA